MYYTTFLCDSFINLRDLELKSSVKSALLSTLSIEWTCKTSTCPTKIHVYHGHNVDQHTVVQEFLIGIC
jgi:hypothetical protein